MKQKKKKVKIKEGKISGVKHRIAKKNNTDKDITPEEFSEDQANLKPGDSKTKRSD